MQKLVTIYLDDSAYSGWSSKPHGKIERHLEDDLINGWSIVSVCGMGGKTSPGGAAGWFAVVLEKGAAE